MFVLLTCEPRRFKSHAGFRFQLVRRVRALGDVNAGLAYDHRSGKTSRVYRELAPKAVNVIGQWLAEALGAGGMRARQTIEGLNIFVEARDIAFLEDGLGPVDSHDRAQRRYFTTAEKASKEPAFNRTGRLLGDFWQPLKSNRRRHIRITG